MSISATTAADPNPDLIKKITRYIPTEAIALYVAAFVFVDPVKRVVGPDGAELPLHRSDFSARWVFASVFVLLVTPLLVQAVFWHRAWRDKLVKDRRWKRQRTLSGLFAMLALVAWISALPDNPFQDWSWFEAGMGSVALLVMSITLGFVAGPLGLDAFEPTVKQDK